MSVFFRIPYSKRPVLAFSFTVLIFTSAIASVTMHHSVFKMAFDFTNSITVADTAVDYRRLMDPVFHMCSIDLACIYIVEDVTTGKYSTFSNEELLPAYQANIRIWQKYLTNKGIYLNIRISSVGKDDHMFHGSASTIAVNEALYAYRSKGIHAVILSSEDGKFIKEGSFNTVDDQQASSKFIAFLESSPRAAIVLLSTFDDASVYLNDAAKEKLSILGAESKIRFRDSFALVTQKDIPTPEWFVEGHATAGAGPLNISVQIEL